MRRSCIGVVLTLLLAALVATDTPAERAQALLDQMTLDQKLSMVHGVGGDYVGNTVEIGSLSIPSLHLEDGPQGVGDQTEQTTCWPSALTVTASWDADLFYQFGAAMSSEQRIKGSNVMLGPMTNIARVPVGGRNFESTGEDPTLASVYAAQSVKGIQSQGVIACSKHVADNNQEFERKLESSHVDERTQYEIYYPHFKAAIDAGVGSLMCSYNKVNDTWACENDHLLNGDMKATLGFQGFVVSDWGAVHSTVESALGGLDLEMPDDQYFGTALAEAVASGEVSEACIDDKVLRILTSMFAVGLFDNPQTGNRSVDSTSTEHNTLARDLSAAGTVLLKNSNKLLPLDAENLKKIAVIGRQGHDVPLISGYGSGHVRTPYIITPYDGIVERATGVNVTYTDGTIEFEAVQAAKDADVAIVVVGAESTEGVDRLTLALGELGNSEDDLISAVANAQPNTIVVINSPGAVLMPWESLVPSIVERFFPGQEDGHALSQILFGDVNPSGKLPLTFPMTDDQNPLQTKEQYPGVDRIVTYSEGLLVGYRWYDAQNETPLYPFGHGLSYTSFDYSTIYASSVGVKFVLKNTGSVAGAEVAQLYLGYPPEAGEPPKVLRGFNKVLLSPGESSSVYFELSSQDFSIWDVESHMFIQVHGTFTAYVGSSSRDIRLQTTFTV
ncbi:glycoside hydrolase superfamily [Pelomyxa schiedti]|nr:glycoside hydrolase superfamily [Pelomyxa schiedti]